MAGNTNLMPTQPKIIDWAALVDRSKAATKNALADKKALKGGALELGAGYAGEAVGLGAVAYTRNLEDYKGTVRGGSIFAAVLADGIAKFTGHHKTSRAAFGFQATLAGAEVERHLREKDLKELAEGKGPLAKKESAASANNFDKGHGKPCEPGKTCGALPSLPASQGELMDAQGRVMGYLDSTSGAFRPYTGPGNRGFGTQPGLGAVDPIYNTAGPSDGAVALPEAGATSLDNRGGLVTAARAPALFRQGPVRQALYRALRRRGVPHVRAAAGADMISTEADCAAAELDLAGLDPETSGDPQVEGVVDEAIELLRRIAKQAARQVPDQQAQSAGDDELLAVATGIVLPIDRADTGEVHYTGGDGDPIDTASIGASLDAVASEIATGDIETGARQKLRARIRAVPRKRAIRKAARYQREQANRALAEQQAKARELEAQRQAQYKWEAQNQMAQDLAAQNQALEAQLSQQVPDTTYYDQPAYADPYGAYTDPYSDPYAAEQFGQYVY